MRGYILAFAMGVILLQQQSELPGLRWAAALLPLALMVFFLFRCQNNLLAVTGRTLLAILFLTGGFFWAAALAQLRVSDALPPEWEGRDIQVAGVVAELPQSNESGVRFVFDVEQVLTPDAVVPERISLAWYKDKERRRSARAEAVPQPVSAGERWQLTTRLKRPHGTINPHGFDFEQWALEHNLRASGYVRKSDRNIRLEETVNRPSYLVERLRQEIRERFLDILAGNDYAGILVALAVGDQRAIPPEQWQILTRTGVNHLMSISGLHVTMVSGLIFSLVYGLWRRSHQLTLWLPARKAARSQ